jgi:hypothetical protein
MTKRRTISALTMAAATLGLGAATVRADQPATQADLQKQIEQLQAQVKDMQAQRATPTYNAKDVDATVDSVLRDADKRSQLLATDTGFYGGWTDGGFRIRSADGNYELQPYLQFQFRNVINVSEAGDDDGGGDDDTSAEEGFEVRRMKFGFQGTAVTKALKYNFRWATDRNSGTPVLELAYVTYNFADNNSVKIGQWKDNVFQEETTSSGKQLAVERSLLNELLGGGLTDYVQGIAWMYDSEAIRAELSYHDGANSDNTNFQDGGQNFGVSGRLNWKAMGDWKAYEDFSAMNNRRDLLVIGAGGDWTQMGDMNVYFHTVDAQFETGALGLYGAYVGRLVDGGEGADDTYDWGFLVQAGYMLNDRWELFGRYDMATFEDDLPNGEDTIHELTAGVNYYIKGHSAKISVDVTWLPSGSPVNVTGNGILGQGDDEDQFIIRGQFQLLI